MKPFTSSTAPRVEDAGSEAPRASRRRVVVGAGVAAGAAVAAATVARHAAPNAVAVTAEATAPTASGYRLTEHVRRYYETTRT
jgi:hypothetical protein